MLVTLRAESLPPLSISPVPPILIPSGIGWAKRSILVSGPGEITVTASSSDRRIFRDSDVFVSPQTGPAGPRKLFVAPLPGVFGESTITLRASGGGAEYSTTFPVRVEIGDPHWFRGGPIQINDNAPATPYPSTITVGNFPGILRKVEVTLSAFSHTYPQDVDILLESPSGERVLLLSDAGGGNPVTNLNLRFGT